jgi:hypothetical protein
MSRMKSLYYYAECHFKKYEWLRRLLERVERCHTTEGRNKLITLYELTK